MESTVIAVDVAKSVFQIAISKQPGRVAREARVRRARLLEFFAQQPPAAVVMEACGSAHYWARQLEQLGHRAVLLPAHCVRPYVSRDKTDRADARALLEAHRNRSIHPVPVKTQAQQILTTHHRMRQSWVGRRTAVSNSIRAVLREQGIFLPAGGQRVVPMLRRRLRDEPELVPTALLPVLEALMAEIEQLEVWIEQMQRRLLQLTREDPAVQLYQSIPGIGPLTATALVAFVGDTHRFPTCRHLASYVGLTPRVRASGLRCHHGRISKRGNAYLRFLLIQGARSLLVAAARKKAPDRLSRWALAIAQRLPSGQAAVAVANKLARILWAVQRHQRPYRSQPT